MLPDEEIMTNDNEDYINAINELKANSVDKAKYEKLKEENRKLLDSLVNNTPNIGVTPDKPDPNQLRHALFDLNMNGMTNLDYCKKALALREAVLEEEGRDIFVPGGHSEVSDSDYQTAQRVADVLQECLDNCNDDNKLFTALLQNRIVDTGVRR